MAIEIERYYAHINIFRFFSGRNFFFRSRRMFFQLWPITTNPIYSLINVTIHLLAIELLNRYTESLKVITKILDGDKKSNFPKFPQLGSYAMLTKEKDNIIKKSFR